MGNSAVTSAIERASKTGVLSVADCGLEMLPKEVHSLQLRTLNASSNRLRSLPDRIAEFQQLKVLDISKNRLTSLPASMDQLSRLETLILSDNQLNSLPSLPLSLKTVNLSGNSLTVFPSSVLTLPHLDVLDLSRNRLSSIPDAVAQMRCIELNLNQNQISRISPDIAKCTRLKVLRLQENCLPLDAIPVTLLKQSNISLLTFEGNLFDLKAFQEADGYEEYSQRNIASRRKIE